MRQNVTQKNIEREREEKLSRTHFCNDVLVFNGISSFTSRTIRYVYIFFEFIASLVIDIYLSLLIISFFLLSFSLSPSLAFQWHQLNPFFFSFVHSITSMALHFSISINNKFQLCEHWTFTLFQWNLFSLCANYSFLFWKKKKKKFQIENALMFSHQRRNCIKATVCSTKNKNKN